MGMNNFTGANGGNPNGPQGGMPINATPQSGEFDPLDFLIDYNAKFATGGHAMFRDDVVHQTMGVLIGKNKPNALLVGPAGTGKTKIVEDIAFRIATHDATLPDKLQNAHVYELPLANIVSGSSYVGQLEEKLQTVLEFVSDPDNDAILFIDEIHQMVSSSNPTYEKIAQLMKPALARGDVRVIGATTTQEAANFIEDPALNRRFSRIIVDELTKEQTVEILRVAKGGFIRHYGNKVLINDDTLPIIVNIADQFGHAGNHRPDNALTLLDRACGDAVVARKIKEDLLKDDPALLAALQANPMIPITETQVRTTAMHLMTGHARKESLDVQSLRAKLSRIKGQDDVIDDVVDRLRRRDANLFPKRTPMTLLFAGASGVGKTEVTKIIAEELTGMRPITLNMTEYHSPASINRIIGAPAGYVGSDSRTELPFDALESNPYQVILLDEFEKADRSVQRLFMGAFDEGYIKTSKGRTVDFSKAIIIATTNASHTAGASRPIGIVGDTSARAKGQSTMDMLSGWFDIELLNRFTKILTFHELTKDVYREIVADTYRNEMRRIKSETRSVTMPDELDDATLDAIVENTYIAKSGARPAVKAVQDYIEDNAI